MLDVDFLGAMLLVLILESPCTIVGRYIASISSNISCQQDHHYKRKANELQNILISVLQAEKGRECHKLPSLVNLSQHMLNRVGKEEFEKLSDVPEWSVFDLSDALFDKFLLFFKLEAEMRPEERKERREKGLGKATALAERGGKAGEGDKMKTLEEVKELQSDLEASFAEEAEVRCNAEQVVEKFSFPLFQSLTMETGGGGGEVVLSSLLLSDWSSHVCRLPQCPLLRTGVPENGLQNPCSLLQYLKKV